MERLTNANIECQYEPVPLIRVFAPKEHLENAFQHVVGEVEKFQRMLNEETHEVTVIENSSTRAIFGAGAQVKHVLVANEFIRVNVGDLPNKVKFNEIELKWLLSKYGEVVACGIKPIQDSRSASRWGWAQFRTPAQASCATKEFDQYYLDDHDKPISCKRGGVCNESQSSVTDARLEVEWSVTESMGKACVTFRTAQEANFVFLHAANCAFVHNVGMAARHIQIGVDKQSPYRCLESGLFEVDGHGNGVLKQRTKPVEMCLVGAGSGRSKGGLDLASAKEAGWSMYASCFSVQNTEDPCTTELFIRGLSYSTDEARLHSALSDAFGSTFGEIKKVVILTEETNFGVIKSRGFGKVFVSSRLATAILNYPNLSIDGRNVSIVESKKPARSTKPQKAHAALLRKGEAMFEVKVNKNLQQTSSPSPPPRIRIGFGLKWAKDVMGADVVLYDNSGKLVIGGKEIAFGESFCVGDLITAAVNMDKGFVAFGKNGKEVGTHKLHFKLARKELRPIVAIEGANVSVNMGAESMCCSALGQICMPVQACINVAPPDPEFKLIIGNLNPTVDETSIREWMEKLGEIQYVSVFRKNEAPPGETMSGTLHLADACCSI
jgi:RNA recognition motif-containing protein